MRLYRYMPFLFGLTAVATTAGPADHFSRLLNVVPADPLAVVYLQSPGELAGQPALKLILEDEAPEVLEVLDGFAQTFDGPLAVAVTGSPLRPDQLGLVIHAKVSHDREGFFARLERQLLARLDRLGCAANTNTLELRRIGDLAFVNLPFHAAMRLTFAHEDGFVLATTNRALLDEWLSPKAKKPLGAAPAGFVQSEDFKRLVPEGDPAPSILAYVNGRPLMSLLAGVLPQEPPLFELFGLAQAEAVGITVQRDAREQRLGLTICRSGAGEGILGMKAVQSRPLTVARLMPESTLVALGGRWTNAGAGLDKLHRLTDMIDPDIAREYEEERAEFTRDNGFDLQADLLGNLVDEWMIGGELDTGGVRRVTLALKVDDPAALASQIDRLTLAYKLKFDRTTHRGIDILQPREARFSAAFAVLDQYWLIGRNPDDVSAMIDAWTDEKSLHQASAYRRAEPGLNGATLFGFVHVQNLARLARTVNPTTDDGELEAKETFSAIVERLADSPESALTFALRPTERSVELALAARGDAGASTVWDDLLAGLIMPSFARAREQAKRAVSMGNVRGIVTTAMIAANDRKGEWPPSLSSMLESGALSIENLRNPYDGTAPRSIATADLESFYLYRPVGKVPNPAETVVVAERYVVAGEGAVFGFADGHAEFVREPRASELLAVLRSR